MFPYHILPGTCVRPQIISVSLLFLIRYQSDTGNDARVMIRLIYVIGNTIPMAFIRLAQGILLKSDTFILTACLIQACTQDRLMEFNPPLQPATLVARYKRFLADVITAEGEEITLHCANTGAMTGCAIPGDQVWYMTSRSLSRKYPHSWELTLTQNGDWISVNTLRANYVVREAIREDLIPEFSGYSTLKSEVKYGIERSRIDLLLQADDRIDCYIEVKSVTLSELGKGYFPDAVTQRGQKHLRELIDVAARGYRSVLFFAVMHSGIDEVFPARHIDKKYAELLLQAKQRGVEIMAYSTMISPDGIWIKSPVAVKL